MTRRDLLKYGVAGSAAVLLGPRAASSASASPRRRLGAARSANAAQRGGTLRFARSVGPTTLDPANTIIAGDIYTLDKILEPLYVTNPAGQLVPWLATGYELSADHRTFTFALRPGVKFSNGKPLVADDVVFSINRTRKDAAGPLSFLDYAITDIEAKGTDSVVFQLSSPWAPFVSDISVFANAVLPADFGGQSEKDFFNAPIGTGPFILDGFTPDANSLTLKANPDYWQAGKPYLDAVEFLYVDNDNQRVLQIQGGQVDIIDTVPPANVSSLKASSGLNVDLFPAWQVDLLVMNERLPQFADRHVRRAITYAIDRPALVHAASFGTAKPGGSFFPPSLQYYSASTPGPRLQPGPGQGRAGTIKVPQGFFDQAAYRRGRPEMGYLRRDHQGATAVHRHKRRDHPPRPLRLRVDVPEVRLRHVHRLRHQRHQRPGRNGFVRSGREERRVGVVLVQLRQPDSDQPGARG